MTFFRDLRLKYTAVGLAVAAAVTFLSLFLIAIVMYYADIDMSFSSPLSLIALSIGCAAGGFTVSALHKSNGMLHGVSVSAALFVLLVAATAAVKTDSMGINTLLHGAGMLLSGGIGGIFGVNRHKKVKI